MTIFSFARGNLVLGRMVDRLGVIRILNGVPGLSTACFMLAGFAPSMAVLSLIQLGPGLDTKLVFCPLAA